MTTHIDFLVQYMNDAGKYEMLYFFEEDRITESDLVNAGEAWAWTYLERDDINIPEFGCDINGVYCDIDHNSVERIVEYTFEGDTWFDTEIEIQVLKMKNGKFLIGDFGRG